MARFKLHSLYDMDDATRERFGIRKDDDYGSILEDTVTGETWTDGGEPEDAYFHRDWNWVPKLLNKLVEENAALRAATDQFLKDAPDMESPDFHLKQAGRALMVKLVALKHAEGTP